jgi:hypothetical protein
LSDQLLLEKIKEMAKLTMVSGRINSIQEKNLKMYPFVFFDGIKNAKIDYDFSNAAMIESKEDKKAIEIAYKIKKPETCNMYVAYHLELESDKNDHLEKRFKALENAIHTLFWKEVKIKVYFNDKIVFGE